MNSTTRSFKQVGVFLTVGSLDHQVSVFNVNSKGCSVLLESSFIHFIPQFTNE
jgi:hypothetical protein